MCLQAAHLSATSLQIGELRLLSAGTKSTHFTVTNAQMYEAGMWAALVSVASGLAASLLVRRRSVAHTEEAAGVGAEAGSRTRGGGKGAPPPGDGDTFTSAGNAWLVPVCSLCRLVVVGLRLYYVAASVAAFRSRTPCSPLGAHGAHPDVGVWVGAHTDGTVWADASLLPADPARQACDVRTRQWTIDFCLSATALASFGNGLSTRTNAILLLSSLLALCPPWLWDAAHELLQQDTGMYAKRAPEKSSVKRKNDRHAHVPIPDGLAAMAPIAGQALHKMLQMVVSDGLGLVRAAGVHVFGCVRGTGGRLLMVGLSLYLSRLETASSLSSWISLQVTLFDGFVSLPL